MDFFFKKIEIGLFLSEILHTVYRDSCESRVSYFRTLFDVLKVMYWK